MTDRAKKGANSEDFFLMFLGDVNVVATIADNDAIVFDEATERFVPSSAKTINMGSIHFDIDLLPSSSDGLNLGDVYHTGGTLKVIVD